MRRLIAHILVLASCAIAAAAPARDRIEIVWPTPNPAWAEGRPIEAYIQPTVSGEAISGCFGGVRSDGFQFHEGLDLKPVARDRRGEPADEVFAAMDGVVVHVNSRPGESNYGRYLVIEHTQMVPAVYTLYAHLARVLPGIAAGARVARGQAIAVMGHSAGGYAIPKDRAHLHFEIGLMMTRDFQRWYERKRFGSPNEQGIWNGMNLMGFDPLAFLDDWRSHRVDNFQEFLSRMKPEVRLRIATRKVPDFIERYPSLLTAPRETGPVAGWEICCDWTGLPFAWRALSPLEVAGMAPNQVAIIAVDHNEVVGHRAKVLVRAHRGGYVPGRDLEIVLQQLFALR